ncbi:Abhydrolase domain-containing protein [Ceratobasidium sp. AG-Ba]|nr:Abhydrolase domain-containing protein [Ceratobasidium sp. AG-Ba]
MPDRIGRGMIEAVVNPALWVDQHSHEWMDNWTQDADEAYHWFLDSCAGVGETKCALARGNASAKAIEDRIERFMNELYDRPMPSINSIVPAFLTSGDVRSKLFDAMKDPFAWPQFAVLLDKAMNGDPAPFMNPISCGILPDLARDRFDHAELARCALTCSDARAFKKSDPASFPTPESLARGIFTRVNNTSRHFGGPGLIDIDVVIVKHGVTFPSLCQYQASLGYFSHGILPEDGLNCKTDRDPFALSESSLDTMPSEDKKLLETGEELIRTLGEIRRGRI